MNALTSIILWMSVQVALFSLVGCGLFFALRRRGPRAGATCTAIVLGLTVVLAMLAISPWPRWTVSDLKPAPAVLHESIQSTIGSPTVTDGTASVVDKNAAEATVSMFSVWWSTAMDFLRTSTSAAPAATTSQSAWRTWVPMVLLAGVVLCLLRLVIGIWAVRRLRSRTQLIADEGLSQIVREMAIVVGSQAVELRQSSLLRSAVTIGWRRPLLLLPCDWPSWTLAERRAVLAHELVHVAQRDYATGLIARLATAIHFYQPLVLWLSRQLRIHQELAADSQAAILSGNRQTYLTTLAQMALRADEQPLPWAARAFLPGTSSLIKRVAWLKRKGNPMEKTLSRSARWILGAAMAAIALAVAGIRGPSESASPLLAQTSQNQPDQKSGELKLHLKGEGTITITGEGNAATLKAQELGFELKVRPLRGYDYVPANAKLVVAISPSEMAQSPAIAKLMALIDAEHLISLGPKLAEIADIKIIKLQANPVIDRAVFQTVQPFDWAQMLAKHFPPMRWKRLQGSDYLVMDESNLNRTGRLGPCFYIPNDRTLIAGTESEIQRIIGLGGLMSPETFPALATSPIAVRIETSLLRDLGALDKKNLESNPALAMFLPLIEQTKVTTLAGNVVAPNSLGKDLAGFTLSIECNSPEAAQTVAKTLEAARTLASNILVAKKDAWRESVGSAVKPEDMQLVGEFIATINKALADTQITAGAAAVTSSGSSSSSSSGSSSSDTQIKADAATVTAHTNINIAPPMIGAVVMPALAASREAAMREQTMNNLKQLALAMYVYADKHGDRFPPPVVVGPDGKTKHSWRVEVLPLLNFADADAVYKEYRLDEPWDSEHNRMLIDKMPAVFRDPHEDTKSGNASYFMPTGKGMIGGSEEGVKLQEIIDGTSQTISLVEAKRDIPWTKPEDIEIDPDLAKPLPKFGGYLVGGIFAAAFADGHVEVIADSVDPKILRALLTIAGREPVSDFVAPPAKLSPNH